MSLKSGFYNAIETSVGVYDRVYSADEYTNFYSAFLKDGVRRSGDNDFMVSASGLVLTVAQGYAICGSKWIHNETAEILPTITPPTGLFPRIDGVFLHVDTNEATRAASFVYRQGEESETPDPPAKDTSAGVYELCLCYVEVMPNATAVSITDKRGDSSVCGWVTSPVGYDDYFTEFETAFNTYMQESETAFDTWFSNLRETVATTTLFKQYTQYVLTSGASTSSVEISIVQYDPTGVDILQVYCNGMLLIAGQDYTASGTTITFTTAKIAGTQILIVVYKSIDGAGLGSVSDAVEQLQNDVAELQSFDSFVVEHFTQENEYSIPAGGYVGYFYDISKEGYTPVGIVELVATGTVVLTDFWIQRPNDPNTNLYNINIGLHNEQTVAATFDKISYSILYVKNAE